MTRRSMYTGEISPLFSLNSPNLTACCGQVGGAHAVRCELVARGATGGRASDRCTAADATAHAALAPRVHRPVAMWCTNSCRCIEHGRPYKANAASMAVVPPPPPAHLDVVQLEHEGLIVRLRHGAGLQEVRGAAISADGAQRRHHA